VACGYDVRLLDRQEIARLEPHLINLPEQAAYAAGEGAVDPVEVTKILVGAAQQYGAAVRFNTGVSGLVSSAGRITGIRTHDEIIDADVVVLAAGTGISELCDPIGVVLPIKSSPAILLRFTTPGRLVNSIISSPEFEIRQPSGDSLLAAEDYIDDSPENGPDAIAQRALAAIQQGLRGGEAIKPDKVQVGIRPIPADGLPIIGFASQIAGLYLAVMHAGITLAPLVGHYAAREIVDGIEVADLAGCRPDRFV
jgi:glycine/D-amino acid oxidase-like deaminating enzyme